MGMKIYRDTDEKLHPIVRAMRAKGHKNIVVEFHGAIRNTRGWWLQSHAMHKRYLDDVVTIVKKIKESERIEPTSDDNGKEE